MFKGKVALVTGGGTGIGQAIARAFAGQGAAVVVAGRSAQPLAGTVKLIEEDGGTASAVSADVTKAADVEALVATAVQRHGGLHIAVNNAGILRAAGQSLADVSEADFAELLAVNVTSVWLSMKYEIVHMRAHGGGVVINIGSSLGAHKTVAGTSGYSATKAAVSALSRSAALEYVRDGVRVNTISPGPHDTSMSLHPGETEAGRDQRMADALPAGRVGSLDEIASAAVWLASPGAGFAIGHDLLLDGGSAL
jgi:NAD(P)-dependent dehydrogenase (short-subunit alcohol dehydrogenase family)